MSNKSKKTRHSKIKNTGILFELLTRKLTSDIINGVENSIAQKLIEKYFKNTTELGKEYVLYQALTKQRFDDKDKAEDFLIEVINAHKKLKINEIKHQKYQLIREINENFDLDDFFKPRIENYKLLASIYKIFQAKSLDENVSPEDIVNSKFTIIEHILGKNNDNKNKMDEIEELIIKEYINQDEDLRLLAYKILIDKFNEKYSVLDVQQKRLIKEYINNISSVNSLNTYIKNEIPVIQKELSDGVKKITDQVIKIKINEVINQLELMKSIKNYDDNHVMAILNSYELIKEISNVN